MASAYRLSVQGTRRGCCVFGGMSPGWQADGSGAGRHLGFALVGLWRPPIMGGAPRSSKSTIIPTTLHHYANEILKHLLILPKLDIHI